jgi:Na+/proline symporter
MSEQEKNNTFLLIFIIVFVIIIYVGSFGQVDLTIEKVSKQNDEVKDNLNKLQSRHEKLKALIQKKEALNIKLNKRFKRIYFGVRFVLASVYVGYNAILYFVFNVTKLGDVLNWNQFALIVIALFSFIAFGTLTNVQDFINTIKMKLESRTYDKYVDITEQLETHKEEAIKLTATITKTKSQIQISNKSVVEEAVLIEGRDEVV